MPDIEVNIELYCATCEGGISDRGTAKVHRGQPCFYIEACATCIEKADVAGYERGYQEGLAAGRANG